MIVITGLLALIFICGLPNSEAASPVIPCKDSNPQCPGWARNKQCESNPGWMLKNCMLSCGQCGSNGPCTIASEKAMKYVRQGLLDHPVPHCKPDGTYEEVQCNPMTGCWCVTSEGKEIQGTYVARPNRPNCGSRYIPECKDDNDQCPGWASRGECAKNPSYMHETCRMSCRVCSGNTGKKCIDENDQCSAWASRGECAKNPSYMHETCRMSCLVCPVEPIPPHPGYDAENEEKDDETEKPLDKDENENEEEDEEEDEDKDEEEDEEEDKDEDVNKDASEEAGNDEDGSDVYIYNFTGSNGKKSQSDQ